MNKVEAEEKCQFTNKTGPESDSALNEHDRTPTLWKVPAEFVIALNLGQTIGVKFVPGKTGKLRMHQFDFRGSVSVTGFYSQFVLGAEAERFGSPVDYAQAYAETLVTQFEKEQHKAKGRKRSRSAVGAIAAVELGTTEDKQQALCEVHLVSGNHVMANETVIDDGETLPTDDELEATVDQKESREIAQVQPGSTAARPQSQAPLSNTSKYVPINQLEQYVRQWLFTPECPDQALEEIKAKTQDGKQAFKSLRTSIKVPHRVSDLRQACNNVLAQLGHSPQRSSITQEAKPTASVALALPESLSEPSIVMDSTLTPDTSEPSSLNLVHSARGSLTSTVEVLTPEEESDRHRLELKVERAFYEAGASLRELRDRRLYRSTHNTFEQYCRERFGFQRRHSYQLIDAAGVIENLCAIGAHENLGINGAQVLPTSERQVRPLTALEPDKQREVWQQAVNKAGGQVPSGRIVKGIVERLKERGTTPPPMPYSDGDVVEIRAGVNSALRKHNGCWGIVTHVGSFSCTVHISVRNVNVQCKPDEMDIVDPKYTVKIKEVSDRVAALARCDLDPAAWSVLETLNRQTCFTQFQLDLLAWVEQRYGIQTYDN